MKEAYWGYWLMVLGIFIIVVLLLVQNFTSTNSQDFYMVKEIAEAAMEDALDYGYYRTYGEAKINKEKFYESFIRRFAEEASLSTTYTIEFTEVYEAPPKIGVKVSSKSNSFSIFGNSESFDIINRLDAIMEAKATNRTTTATIGPSTYHEGNYEEYFDKLMIEDVEVTNRIKSMYKDCKVNHGEVLVDAEIHKCGLYTYAAKELDADDLIDLSTTYCVLYEKGISTNYIAFDVQSFEWEGYQPYCTKVGE